MDLQTAHLRPVDASDPVSLHRLKGEWPDGTLSGIAPRDGAWLMTHGVFVADSESLSEQGTFGHNGENAKR